MCDRQKWSWKRNFSRRDTNITIRIHFESNKNNTHKYETITEFNIEHDFSFNFISSLRRDRGPFNMHTFNILWFSLKFPFFLNYSLRFYVAVIVFIYLIRSTISFLTTNNKFIFFTRKYQWQDTWVRNKIGITNDDSQRMNKKCERKTLAFVTCKNFNQM